jgi:hypothetical protein
MGRPKLAKNIPKKGPLFRCKYGHVRCKGGEACEKAYQIACGTAGAPTAWKPEHNNEIIAYFTRESFEIVTDDKDKPHVIPADKFPTFEGFAVSIDVDSDTLREWAKDENKAKYPGFSAAFTRAHELQKKFLFEMSMSGAGSAQFAQFFAKNNFGMRDTTDHTNNGEAFKPPVIVDPSGEPFKFSK